MDAAVILPASYDIVWSILALASLVLLAVAGVRWARTSFDSAAVQLVWAAVILLVPVLGPIAFLVLSPVAARQDVADGS